MKCVYALNVLMTYLTVTYLRRVGESVTELSEGLLR